LKAEKAATVCMLDVPLDAVYYWVGLSVVSLALVGVATDLPTRPPPDATAVANTVDAIAASTYDATAEHPLSASQIRLTPYAIGLRSDAGASHATFAFAPVTPVGPGTQLGSVASGTPPEQAFDDPAAFAAAAERARASSTDGASPRGSTGTGAATTRLRSAIGGPGAVSVPSADRPQSSRPATGWRSAPDVLVVRQVNWGDVRVTLVLA
jgi:hypothetical protein